ncbi:MAG: bifunctional phosphoglucose/phosphomannose isomerase, partial [Chloroflexota bacterium]
MESDTNLLDQPQRRRELDASGMASHIQGLAQQCQQAWQLAQGFKLPAEFKRTKRVVVCGMGGSAIGGDLVQGLASLEGKPVIVHRDYGPPPFLDGDTLVVFCSYSGMTEETLSAFEASIDSPAKKLVLTSGGRLGELAKERGIPHFPITYQSPPRAALGFTFIGLLGLLAKTGFLADKERDFGDMLQTLTR